MQQFINEKAKRVELWLTNADQQDNTIMNQARILCRQWHEAGYLAVMFLSGKRRLEDSIDGLLRHQIQVMAKREVAAEKSAQSQQITATAITGNKKRSIGA